LAQRLYSPPSQCSSSQGALCQAFSGPKIDYWNGTPTIFPWFGPKWLLPLSEKTKSALKGRRFQDTEDIKKSDDTESYSTTGLPKNVSNSWAKCILRRWPLAVSPKYTGMLTTEELWELHSHTSYRTFTPPYVFIE
jgi:hypothetical protein